MDKFKLEIELGNDAMQSGADVADALRKIANRLDDTLPVGNFLGGVIRDGNGNKVGSYEVALGVGATEADYTKLTDHHLAEVLHKAWTTEDDDMAALAENEVAGRLDLPLDQTEQGFTAEAMARVERFVKDNYKEVAV